MNITRENLTAISGILKKRFNSLTAEETIELSCEILEVIDRYLYADAKPGQIIKRQ